MSDPHSETVEKAALISLQIMNLSLFAPQMRGLNPFVKIPLLYIHGAEIPHG